MALLFFLNGAFRTTYSGNHFDLSSHVESHDLSEMKAIIENLIGENLNGYQSAWIYERNPIGRLVRSYYFSEKDNQWHFIYKRWNDYGSWSEAVFPVRQIMLFVLNKLGYKSKQDFAYSEYLKKCKIDELYDSD